MILRLHPKSTAAYSGQRHSPAAAKEHFAQTLGHLKADEESRYKLTYPSLKGKTTNCLTGLICDSSMGRTNPSRVTYQSKDDSYLEVSINGGTQKWMVNFMENPWQKWMI